MERSRRSLAASFTASLTPALRRPLTALVAVCLGSCLVASSAFAQSPSEDAPEELDLSFLESIDVEIVNIDVRVTDRDGTSVEGLTVEDFVVFRDGLEIRPTNFYAVADGRPVSSPSPAAPGESPASEVAPEATPEVEEPAPPSRPAAIEPLAPEHRLWLVIFVDNYNIDPTERDRVVPAIRQFIGRTLRPGDRVTLATYDRALEMRVSFTEDLALVQNALEALDDDSGLAVVRRRELIDTLRRIEDARNASGALAYARQYAEELMDGVERTVEALERFVDTLGGLPGRKALLHVSSGIPMLAGEELFQIVGEKYNLSQAFAEIPRHDTSRAFERLDRLANAHRVVFYTLDAGGNRGMEFGNAEYGGFLDSDIRRSLDSLVPENLQSPLRLMAIETGGQAIVNRNEIRPALEEVAEDFRSFYSLGISSSGVESGREHSIEVKLRDQSRDWTVRHRTGYRSKTRATRVREELRSALLYAYEANPLDVEIRLGEAEPHDEETWMLPIQVQVPLRDLVLLPRDGKHELALELFVGVVSEQGEVSAIDAVPLGLRLAEEHVAAARRESFVYTHKLLVDPGRKKVGISVLDRLGGTTSTVTRFVAIGSEKDLEAESSIRRTPQ